jgi:signal transduction histidine kinase
MEEQLMVACAMRATHDGWAMVWGRELGFTNPTFNLMNARARGRTWTRVGDEQVAHSTLRRLVVAEARRPAPPTSSPARFRAGDQVVELQLERVRTAGRLPIALAIVVDVTAQVRAQAEAQAAREALRRDEGLRALGELALGTAHDVRNVLAAMSLRISLLQGERGEPARHLLALQQAVAHGQRLVARLQDIGHGQEMPPAPIDLGDAIRGAVDVADSGLRFRACQEGIGIHIETDIDNLPPVWGIQGEIERVFVNLLVNGAAAMKHGGTIRISGAVERGTVVVKVTDEGPGIPPAALPHIFEPFFTTKGTKGTGLGLSIARRIMQEIGGRISAQNLPRHGACFDLRFRRAPVGPLSRPAPATRDGVNSPRPRPLDPRGPTSSPGAEPMATFGLPVAPHDLC